MKSFVSSVPLRIPSSEMSLSTHRLRRSTSLNGLGRFCAALGFLPLQFFTVVRRLSIFLQEMAEHLTTTTTTACSGQLWTVALVWAIWHFRSMDPRTEPLPIRSAQGRPQGHCGLRPGEVLESAFAAGTPSVVFSKEHRPPKATTKGVSRWCDTKERNGWTGHHTPTASEVALIIRGGSL